MRVEGLSKRYRNGSQCGGRYQYKSLRGVITNVFAAPFRRLRENSQSAIPVCRCTGRRNSQFEIGTGSRRSALSARRSVSPILRFALLLSHFVPLSLCPFVPVSLRMSKVTKVATSPIHLTVVSSQWSLTANCAYNATSPFTVSYVRYVPS